jgi:serine/threonine protein kinase
VAVIDFVEEPVPSIIMEYCPLGSLDRITPGVRPAEVTRALQQMLEGLSHLHWNDIAHRDLKPANLLVAERVPLHIKITDFGIAGEISGDVPLASMVGTALYAAPDLTQCPGHGTLVDIWSAGVVALELAFGLPSLGGLPEYPDDGWFPAWPDRLAVWLSDVGTTDEAGSEHGVSGESGCGDVLADMLRQMLTAVPEARPTAQQCLKEGRENGLFEAASIFSNPTDRLLQDSDDDGTITPTMPQSPHAGSKRRSEAADGEQSSKRRARSQEIEARASSRGSEALYRPVTDSELLGEHDEEE